MLVSPRISRSTGVPQGYVLPPQFGGEQFVRPFRGMHLKDLVDLAQQLAASPTGQLWRVNTTSPLYVVTAYDDVTGDADEKLSTWRVNTTSPL